MYWPTAAKKSFPKKGNPGLLANTIILKSGCILMIFSDDDSTPVSSARSKIYNYSIGHFKEHPTKHHSSSKLHYGNVLQMLDLCIHNFTVWFLEHLKKELIAWGITMVNTITITMSWWQIILFWGTLAAVGRISKLYPICYN